MKSSRRTWPRLVRFCARTFLVLLLLGIPALLVALQTVGLPRHWTAPILDSLSGSNYRLSIDRLTFGLLSGFTARGLRLETPQGEILAEGDRITLSPNLAALREGRFIIDSLEVDQANWQIPLSNSPSLRLENVTTRIRVLPGQLHLSQLTFLYSGIKFHLSGTLLNPANLRLPSPANTAKSSQPPPPSPDQPLEQLKKIQAILSELQWSSPTPILQAEISGDLQDLSSLEVKPLTFRTGPLHWRGATWDALTLEASWQNQTLNLVELLINSGSNRAVLQGRWNAKTKSGNLSGASSLDLWPWAAAAGYTKRLSEFRPPRQSLLEAQIEFNQTDSGSWDYLLLGGLKISDAAFREIPIDLLQAEFALKPGKIITRRARLKAAPVEATIDFLLEHETAQLRAHGFADPTRCLPWLDQGMKRIFSEMEFSAPGEGSIELSWPLRESAKLTGRGHIKLGPTAMRGSWIDSAEAEVEIADRAVTYRNLQVRRDSGLGTGTFVYDFGQQQVRLENIVSTLDPYQIMLWVDRGIAETIRVYRFRSAPKATADGVVYMKEPEKTRLDLQVQADRVDYDLLGRTLEIGRTLGNITVRGQRLQARIPTASLFNGNIALEADVSLASSNPTYSLTARADRLDFAPLTSLYFDYTESTGWMSGNLSYRATFSDQTRLEGTGFIRIDDGNVFAIPLLGPFSAILNTILPGVGYQNARSATADFTVGNQTISTDNLEIIGQGFSLYGEGDIYFVADRLDMAVRINAQGVPGLLLFPVSKLFEYTSYGTVSDPVWRPKNLPRELMGISDEQAQIPGRSLDPNASSTNPAGKIRRRK
jgi:hypothetical protein